MKCPKCGYERQPSDDAPEWQCPACKVAYAKVLQLQAQAAAAVPVAQSRSTQSVAPPDDGDDALQERHWLVARGQKMVIYSILLNILLRAVDKSLALPALVAGVLFVCIAVYAIAGVVKICSGLGKTQNQKILFMVMSFVPLINLISLVYLNAKASRMLRAAGWRVGWLGAKP